MTTSRAQVLSFLETAENALFDPEISDADRSPLYDLIQGARSLANNPSPGFWFGSGVPADCWDMSGPDAGAISRAAYLASDCPDWEYQLAQNLAEQAAILVRIGDPAAEVAAALSDQVETAGEQSRISTGNVWDWYQNTPAGVRLAIGLGVALVSINLLEAARS